MKNQVSVETISSSPKARPAGILGELRQNLSGGELGAAPVVLGLALIWLFFQFQDAHFLTPRNMSNLVLQISVSGTIAIGVVFVLLLGEIDLSVGSVAGASAAVLGVLMVNQDWPWWAAIIVMLAFGTFTGVIQGAWYALMGVPSFVVTLAGLLIWLGVQLHVLGDAGTLNVFDPHITAIASTFLPPFWGWVFAVLAILWFGGTRLRENGLRQRAGMTFKSAPVLLVQTIATGIALFGAVAVLNAAYGVPTAGVVLFVLVAVFDWIARRTTFGRHIYAVGGQAEAARRAGISVARIRISVFAIAGFLAAAGGLISTARLQAASTQTGGGTLLLEAIAAAVIGGTSLFGGRGRVWAALLGALVIGSVSNGLDLIGEPADVKYMVEGAILLLAVTLDSNTRRRLSFGRIVKGHVG
ncbi:sugar ABC transporter permease [Mesorhizobium sp. M3A.F.Ca.ET.080.04.2.1]|uniref:sugar ABC transporter permease n=1 Tax=Mesorhizobium sp. M3A.F.Ca.ET.080.04.2.1 TaxID=2493676 RepID=UPI000F75CBF3|nr:sugar ABC transporter permease [Mesorhizobium sp. M3A.F.Ca.ET.080.04.2.1]AZO07950.1 sugar ABC transporter permease [Mesorhizobium sp. M3A.F.Ca.ET.080.04.2.1]